jgi:HAT1-interacting factor 1
MAGLLAQILGQDPAQQKAKLEEAKTNANDLSGLVRKKKAKPAVASNGDATVAATSSNGNGKRKLEDDRSDQEGKKAKVEG